MIFRRIGFLRIKSPEQDYLYYKRSIPFGSSTNNPYSTNKWSGTVKPFNENGFIIEFAKICFLEPNPETSRPPAHEKLLERNQDQVSMMSGSCSGCSGLDPCVLCQVCSHVHFVDFQFVVVNLASIANHKQVLRLT